MTMGILFDACRPSILFMSHLKTIKKVLGFYKIMNLMQLDTV